MWSHTIMHVNLRAHKKTIDKVHNIHIYIYSHLMWVYGHMHFAHALQNIQFLCKAFVHRNLLVASWWQNMKIIFESPDFFKKQNWKVLVGNKSNVDKSLSELIIFPAVDSVPRQVSEINIYHFKLALELPWTINSEVLLRFPIF